MELMFWWEQKTTRKQTSKSISRRERHWIFRGNSPQVFCMLCISCGQRCICPLVLNCLFRFVQQTTSEDREPSCGAEEICLLSSTKAQGSSVLTAPSVCTRHSLGPSTMLPLDERVKVSGDQGTQPGLWKRDSGIRASASLKRAFLCRAPGSLRVYVPWEHTLYWVQTEKNLAEFWVRQESHSQMGPRQFIIEGPQLLHLQNGGRASWHLPSAWKVLWAPANKSPR